MHSYYIVFLHLVPIEREVLRVLISSSDFLHQTPRSIPWDICHWFLLNPIPLISSSYSLSISIFLSQYCFTWSLTTLPNSAAQLIIYIPLKDSTPRVDRIFHLIFLKICKGLFFLFSKDWEF